jgi:hypothetical protein
MALLRRPVSALPGKELKRRFVVSNISVGNRPLCPGLPVAHELRIELLWSRYCQRRARYHIHVYYQHRYICAVLLIDQTYCGAHPASHPVGTGASFPEGKMEGD